MWYRCCTSFLLGITILPRVELQQRYGPHEFSRSVCANFLLNTKVLVCSECSTSALSLPLVAGPANLNWHQCRPEQPQLELINTLLPLVRDFGSVIVTIAAAVDPHNISITNVYQAQATHGSEVGPRFKAAVARVT